MKVLDLFSGISAPSVAWHPLGWKTLAFAEIEPFPCSALAHHYPDTPNLGDVSQHEQWPEMQSDVVVGGSPCQAFSVAGLRKGLDDPRGNLTLTYLAVVDQYRPTWVVWENVPGVLSIDKGRTFGTFLGALGQLGYGFAYRVLDAQYFGVPQRRRRVFVVGHLGDWRRAAAVLFERHSLSGNPAPSREAGENAPTIPSRSTACGGLGTDFDCDGGLVARCVTTGEGKRQDYETTTLVAHSLRAEGFDASEDGTGRGTPLVPVAFHNRQDPDVSGTVTHAIGAKDNGMAVAFTVKDHGGDALTECSPTLRAGGHSGSHANAGVMPAIAFDMRGREGGAMPEGMHDTANIRAASGGSSRSYIAKSAQVRRLTPRECERLQGFPDDYTLVPHRGKPAADGPRYKALGNSMAVPVVRWIGERIQAVQDISA